MSPDANESIDRYNATHDALTGLLNRRGANEVLDSLMEKNPADFAVVIVDLDNLKATNETRGHASGDDLLQRASAVFQDSLRHGIDKRQADTVARGRTGDSARIGGDEFLLFLPAMTEETNLAAFVDRLSDNLEEAGIRASIGGALHTEGMTKISLLETADRLMQANKQARKIEKYSPEQWQVIQHIGQLAAEYQINLRDVSPLLSEKPELPPED